MIDTIRKIAGWVFYLLLFPFLLVGANIIMLLYVLLNCVTISDPPKIREIFNKENVSTDGKTGGD